MSTPTAEFVFELSTPPGWVTVPAGDALSEELEEWFARIGRLSGHGVPPLLDTMMRVAIGQLLDRDVEFGSYFLDLFEHTDPNEPPYLVVATITLLAGSVADDETCPTIAELESEIRAAPGTSLASVRRISLEDGRPALSTSRVLSNVSGPADSPVEVNVLDMRVYVPAPELDQVITLLCVTANTELETELRELFETVAGTLVLDSADEATGT